MKLSQYLQNINKISVVKQLPSGSAASVGELWEKLISGLLPAKDVLLQWHKVLMDYVDRPDAMFAIRGGNSAKKDEYERLRRGFLTRTDKGYSFFYTDNFHAAYFLKMAMDGYVPTVNDLLGTYNLRQFPSRFGRDTAEERELMAMPRGKDPGFQKSGYKLSHIYNVGTDYMDGNKSLSLIGDIVGAYYPYGERNDWKLDTDAEGTCYIRSLDVPASARPYLVAAYLRFVHPFNYFLVPKSSCADNDVSENPILISFVRNKMQELMGAAYDEFLSRIMPPANGIKAPSADTPLHISYSLGGVAGKVLPHNLQPAKVCAKGEMSPSGVKIGAFVQTVVRELLASGAVEEQEIDRLLDKDYCQQTFGLSFAMLSRQRLYQSGLYRSYATPVTIGKVSYYITSQWYKRSLVKLQAWVNHYQRKVSRG